MFDFLLNLLFPPKCPICKQNIKHDGEICENCLKVALNVRKIRKKSAYVAECLTITRYKEGARKIIRDLKFLGKKNRTKHINYILAEADEYIHDYSKNITAVYVPISKSRMKERGFNQVELMFRDWLKKRNITPKNLLVREKATKHQFELNPEERKANVKDAFRATEKLKGENILLIDDIFTTGATIFECAKTLKEAGAGKIFALTFSSDS